MRLTLPLTGLAFLVSLASLGACSGSDADLDPATQAGDGGPGTSSSSGASGSSSSSTSSSSSGSSGTPDASDDAAAPDAGKSTMTFFVTSTGTGAAGANFGGLANADKKCQDLATAVGGGDHTWVAYLGTQDPTLHPRDRIGPGPWRNQKGVMIAPDNKTLHTVNVKGADILDEKGMPVPAKERAILTAAGKSGGTSFNYNCLNWTTSAADRTVWVAHTDSDTNDGAFPNDAWNARGTLPGCDQKTLVAGNSSGRIYCFAKD